MENKRKVVLFIATSLDGYIATKEDSLEWLFKVEGEGDNGYSEFMENVDTILLGRRTYDWVMEAEKGSFPYKEQKCYVFSKTLKGKNEFVEFVDEDIVSFTKRIKKQEGKNIWIVGGGELLHYFIRERLVEEFFITVAPTIIGGGISLFKEIDFQMELKLVNVRRFNQFVELHYVLK